MDWKKVIGAFLVSLIVVMISSSVGASWKVSLIVMAVAFLGSWLFFVLFFVKRDERLDLLQDWKVQGAKRQQAQYDLTMNQRGYRQESINKYTEARNEECAMQGKKFSMKRDKCI